MIYEIVFSPIDGVISMHPKSDKSCGKCGLCAEKCPASAIPGKSLQRL